jgi:hypothetical protein
MTDIAKKLTNRLPFAPIVALLFAGTSAALMMATPVWLLEKWVAKSGLASIVSAAEAPLGFKARILMVVAVALTVGLVTLIAMIPIGRMLGSKKMNRHFAPGVKGKPVAVSPFSPPQMDDVQDGNDAGRYKPAAAETDFGFARAPIFADRELGAPFMTPAPEPVADARVDAEFAPAAAVAPVAPPAFVPSVTVPTPVAAEAVQAAVPEWPPVAVAPIAVEAPIITNAQPEIMPHAPVSEFAASAVDADPLELDMAQIADIPEMEPVAAPTSYEAAYEPAYQPAFEPVQPVQASVEHVESAPTPAADQAAPIAASATDATIDAMLDRFETGLRRRQLHNLVSASSLGDANVDMATNDAAADAALRDALGTLERLAANAR